MKKQILKFIAPEQFDADYDPLLGKSVKSLKSVDLYSSEINTGFNDAPTGSIFDNPDLDETIAPTPIVPIVDFPAQVQTENTISANDIEPPETSLETFESEPIQEDIYEAQELKTLEAIDFDAPEPIDSYPEDNFAQNISDTDLTIRDEDCNEIMPFETLDGEPNEAIVQLTEEKLITQNETPSSSINAIENEALHHYQNVAETDLTIRDDDDNEIMPFETLDGAPNEVIAELTKETIINEEPVTETLNIDEIKAPSFIKTLTEREQETVQEAYEPFVKRDPIDAPIQETIPEEIVSSENIENKEVIISADTDSTNIGETVIGSTDTASSEPIVAEPKIALTKEESPDFTIVKPEKIIISKRHSVPPSNKQLKKLKKRSKKIRTREIILFFAVLTLGLSGLFALISLMAPLGQPFDLITDFKPYWCLVAIFALGSWVYIKKWPTVIIAGLLLILNLLGLFNNLGDAPKGGKNSIAKIGFANAENSLKNITSLVKTADKNGTQLLIIADANNLINLPPQGWTIAQEANTNDKTRLLVLSKGDWRVITLPGEPTMARNTSGTLTIVAINPPAGKRSRKANAERESIINRAAARSGTQETPIIAFADLDASPWHKDVHDFAQTSMLTRVNCGIIGATRQRLGFGIAYDHAFIRDVNIKSCKLGDIIGRSKPIWIDVASKK